MIAGGKVKITFNLLRLWQAGTALLAIISIGLLVAIWMSGNRETDDAFAAGRRLLIKTQDGTVEGKVMTVPLPGTVAANTAAATAPVETPAAPPPAEAKPADTAAPVEIKPAETPVAEVPPATPPATPDAAAAAVQLTDSFADKPVEVPVMSGEEMGPQPQVDTSSKENPVMESSLTPMPLPVSAPAPDPLPGVKDELTEKAQIGPLPIIGPDGSKPWRYYARAFERKGNQPMIAIVVTGLGHNKAVVDSATRLPADISLSFSPYAKDIASWGATARATGHEILLDLPMQPANYPISDPGPYGLLADRGAKENEERLQWSMSRLSAYVGFLTPQNESFSNNDEAFKLLLQSLANRGLLMVIGREPAKNDTKNMIDSTNTATVVGDVLIDEDLSPAVIQTRLATLEQLAKKRGYAVGIARAYPVTLEQLRSWSEIMASRGFVLVPVTAIARLRFS